MNPIENVSCAAPGEVLLSVEDLSVAHGRVEALTGVSLTVRAGEIVTVIGPNGAGKSTLLNALMGSLPARAGAIRLAGEAVQALPVERRVGRGLALVPETRALFASMSVLDNLRLGGYRFRAQPPAEQRRALDEVMALFPRLAERAGQAAATLSGGERQMLAVGRALMGRPRLLMLDEPSLGLAPLIVRDLFRIVAGLRERGVAVLLVEQNARAALRVADRAHVLELGRVVLSGPAAELEGHPQVVAAYLGHGGSHQDRLAA
ncbi:MAG: branched-chain amino acid transport system ATP-binding protein [Pseudomonadota bacterium]